MKPKALAKIEHEPFRARGGMFLGLVFILAVACAVLLSSCGAGSEEDQGLEGGDDGGTTEIQKGEGQGPEAGQTRPAERVTVEELAANPGEFYGDRVVVRGRVIESVEPGVFRIENDGVRLLVVSVEQIPQIVTGDTKAVNVGDVIRVNGEVREFSKEEIEKDVDYGIDEEYFGDYGGDPAVLAYSVEVTS